MWKRNTAELTIHITGQSANAYGMQTTATYADKTNKQTLTVQQPHRT